MAVEKTTFWGGFTLRLGGETIRLTPLKLLVLLAVILRIPSLFEPYWYGDEGIYLTLGEGLRQGLVWYRDIYDNKPPLLYLLAAIAGSVFWFRFLLLVWHAATIVLFWKLVEKLFGAKPKAVILATTVFVVLTTLPLLEGHIANAEIFMIGTTVAAMLLVFWGKLTTKVIFSAGVLFSLSSLFKIPAVFDLLAVFFFWGVVALGNLKKIRQITRQSFILLAGFVLPHLLVAGYYSLVGALPQYISAAFSQNVGYVATWGVPTLSFLGTQVTANLSFRVAILGLVLLLIFLFRKRANSETLFASVWFSFTIFAMLLSARPYPHYALQVVPPLSLLLGILAFAKLRHRFLPVPLFLIFLASLLLYKFYYYPIFPYYQNFLAFAVGLKTQAAYFTHFGPRTTRNYQIAQILASRTTTGERVFIWGTEPELYALSRRLPPGRFVASYHISDFSAQEETLAALQKERPKYIVIIRSETRPFAGFWELFHKNYLFIEQVGDAEVWKAVSPTVLEKLNR